MSEPQSHPRRRPFNKAILPTLSTSSGHGESSANRSVRLHNMKLRKEATFHSPTTPSAEECDPILYIPSLPRRAPTCSRALEDAIAAGERRVADILGNVERNFAGPDGVSSRNKSSLPSDEFPVPLGILDAHIANADRMDIDIAPNRPTSNQGRSLPHTNKHYRQPSDSGIGSSISEASQQKSAGGEVPAQDSKSSSQSAITRSISCKKNTVESSKPTLSIRALKQIERCILIPILREKPLKPFHILVRSVPQRVKLNDITCLRDLEKTLLFLALNYAVSRDSFVNFCEFTIQCIHTTVGFLNDRDQRRPTDRPYTNGYFLDLVEQIRQYAVKISSVGSSSEHQNGDESKLDYSSGEELVLEGGLSSTGRPAELVRKKKGLAISLKTGKPYVESKPIMPSMKRSLSLESEDDSAIRSMARRKKNEPPLNINKKCDYCDKIFRRPCDLTKHEKTHTRPWKCPELSCKYSELGWPTEKERDRHVNDKHSKSPPLYNCRFPPCTYQSKRESNCKQHMEKAHGWMYVRAKNTGKTSTRGSNPSTPRSPNVNTLPSTVTDFPTPLSALAPSPYTSPYQPNFQPEALDNSPTNTFNNTFAEDFPLFPEMTDNGLGDSPYTQPFDFNAFHASLRASNPNEYVPSLDINVHSLAFSSTNRHDKPESSHPSQSPAGRGQTEFELDWDNFDNQYTTLNLQLLTPQSVDLGTFESYSENLPVCMLSPEPQLKVPTFSPGGHGNLMLYSPESQLVDEGFCDMREPLKKPAHDFTLFATPLGSASGQSTMSLGSSEPFAVNCGSMFPPLSSLGGQYSCTDWPDQMDTLDNALDFDEIMTNVDY
ncbi:hypothetical protein PRK78_004056 [Emydomyces testavorans]|uniref:C2H2-type domain-containing protein n=1 Tax=Emydomyces testavorans TaxID=2070801 RepID=A0AAF0IIX5_9EURO|nr:hypothetical protein PRK78_004056 [Emydomyces testavorans]